MVRIEYKDLGNGRIRVHIMDTDIFETFIMNEESWLKIKEELNIDENSENVMEEIKIYKRRNCEKNNAVCI